MTDCSCVARIRRNLILCYGFSRMIDSSSTARIHIYLTLCACKYSIMEDIHEFDIQGQNKANSPQVLRAKDTEVACVKSPNPKTQLFYKFISVRRY
jgi:hypothetical protein